MDCWANRSSEKARARVGGNGERLWEKRKLDLAFEDGQDFIRREGNRYE